MAKSTIVQINDDIDGSANAQTYTFAFQGTEYEIDLSNKNFKAFEKAIKPYVDAGTKTSKRSSPRRPSSAGKRNDLQDVRAWANDQGLEVSERGRISKDILEKYDAR